MPKAWEWLRNFISHFSVNVNLSSLRNIDFKHLHRVEIWYCSTNQYYFITVPLWHILWYSNMRLPPSWWRHQMETFSALLAFCAGNSPVTGEFAAQRPVTQSFDVFFDLGLNKRLSKQSWGWWFETPSRPLWRHCNDITCTYMVLYTYLSIIVWVNIGSGNGSLPDGTVPLPEPTLTYNTLTHN